ncbi:MAG: xanthine dehydrogenase family protein molybdopterin-binding subunit, partial [Candidatus Dormibacterales bacterium]
AGAMRGFGVNQVTFAMDGMLDRLAKRVGIDGWDIRWLNALEVGGTFGTGQLLGPGVGIRKTLLAVKDAYKSAKYAGIGCGVKNTGIGNGLQEFGRAVLRPETDGTVTLFHSWTEMGQGVHTVLSQIACQELGLDLSRVRVAVDTEKELETGQTTASRSTVLGGRAVIAAARKLKAAMESSPVESLAGQEFYGEVSISWTTKPGEPVPTPVTHFAYSWATQVVILDGEGRIERVIAAHDVGKAINPTLVEGQVEGGVHMGLGYALSEEFVVKDSVPVTATLKSQHIIPSTGMPLVEVILVEEPEPEGPYGAKGAGEIGLVPTAAAAAGALFAFDGVRRTRLPMKDSPAARAAVPKLAFAAAHGRDHDHVEEES